MSARQVADVTHPGGERDRRRLLVVLFSDLSDSTLIAASLDAEQYADLLAGLRLAFVQIVAKHGGTIVQIQGDGVLAMFGYPRAGEDDGRRAVEAALDLHGQVQHLESLAPNQPLRMHSGIHVGRVLLEAGDGVRGRFGLLGEPTNIASRLCDMAQAGEIRVSAETLGSDVHFFEFDDLGALTIEGSGKRPACVRIRGRVAGASRFDTRKSFLAAFVGRAAELDFLHERLRRVVNGGFEYVAVVGPPGVGKTRLVSEFTGRATATGCQIWSGWCDSELSSTPLQPLVQVLRAFVGIDFSTLTSATRVAVDKALASLSLDVRHRDALCNLLVAPPADAEQKRQTTAVDTTEAFQAFFTAMAAISPQILFIDDWQWVDVATHKIVLRLVEQRIASVLILVVSRKQAFTSPGISAASTVDLQPLSEVEADLAIEQRLPGLDPFRIAEIRRHSGGNPLFLEELCHFARQSPSAPAQTLLQGSGWLGSLIESRVERLPALQTSAVRAAAIIGNVVPIWLLEAVIECEWSDEDLAGLRSEDLLYPAEEAGSLHFKHGLAREVIYASTGLRQRTELHRKIAAALLRRSEGRVDDELPELLAYHFGAAGEHAEAARFAEIAGDKATAASALDLAQRQYRAALDSLSRHTPFEPQRERWLALSQRLGFVSVFDPAREQLELLRRAVSIALELNEASAIARARYWLGYVNYSLGHAGEAIDQLANGLELSRKISDPALTTQILVTLGQAYASCCQYVRAATILDEGLVQLRTRPRRGQPLIGLAYTLACRASIYGDEGDFVQAHRCFDEALDSLAGIDHEVKSSVLCWRSAVCVWQGQWVEARQSAREAEQIAVRVRSFYLFGHSVTLQCYVDWVERRAPRAAQRMAQITSWLEDHDQHLFISLNYGWLAECWAESGDLSAARRAAAHALSRARQGDRLGEAMACRAMARACAGAGRHGLATRYLSRAEQSSAARHSTHEAAANATCRAAIAELADGRRLQAAL